MRRVRSCKRRLFIKALRGRRLALFIEELKAKRILATYIRELCETEGLLQDSLYHPEGDVWNHILNCVNIAEKNRYSFTLVLASLFHDVGKPVVFDGESFFHHELEGAKIVTRFFYKYPILRSISKKVRRLILDHMKFHHPLSEKTILKLVREYPYLDDLILLTEIDLRGSCGHSEVFDENKRKIKILRHKYEEERRRPSPLLTGYEIMAYLDIPAGRTVGFLKEKVYKAQIAGIVNSKEEALRYLREIFKEVR